MSETTGISLDWLFQILFLLFWMVIIFKGQWLQYIQIKSKIEQWLSYLKAVRDKAKEETYKAFKKAGAKEEGLTETLERLLSNRMIEPTSTDPYGIVEKIGFVLDVREYKYQKELKALLPKATETERKNLENLLEAAFVIDILYKVMRHFFITAEKTKNFLIMLQVSMILPEVLGMVRAMASAFESFKNGQPIGDGFGPMVIANMMRGLQVKKLGKEMVYAEGDLEGRKLYFLKAEGPGGSVGDLDYAVAKILKLDKKIKMILTIDATLKMAGEQTGQIEEGTGVAIGGWGVEKFHLEELAAQKGIRIYCILVKESYVEAISAIKKQITDSIEKVIDRTKAYVLEEVKKGNSVLIIGVGNTIGIGQEWTSI